VTTQPTAIGEITLGYDEDGWAYDTASGLYVRSNTADLDHKTNEYGWLRAKVDAVREAAPSTWSWPEAWDDPIPWSEWYVERHPTRYTWRDDVEALARWLVDNYGVSVNTYDDHPEGLGRDYDSMDVWGSDGRGCPIGYELGQEIFGVLLNDPNPPNIEWIIWWGFQYGAWNNWNGEWFSDDDSDADMGHFRHIHVTYLP
jgi:hypothetical protein